MRDRDVVFCVSGLPEPSQMRLDGIGDCSFVQNGRLIVDETKRSQLLHLRDTSAGRFEIQKLTTGLTIKLTMGIDHEKTPQVVMFKQLAASDFALKSRGDTI